MYKNKADQLASQRRHYRANKQEYLDRNAIRAVAFRKWYQDLKATLKCSTCPESHPACLHFHHVDPKIKVAAIATMIGSTLNKEKVLAEMAKCIILCANCHAKQHA